MSLAVPAQTLLETASMHSFLRDLAFASRSYRRQPAVTLVSLAAMTLAIGALTVVFSTVHTVLVRPLPFAEPEELVFVWAKDLEDGGQRSVSYPDWESWQAGSGEVLDDLIAVGDESFTLGAEEADALAAERVPAEWVSPGYFDLLGVAPAAGRSFAGRSATAPSGPVVILGHGLWQTRFGGRPELVGSSLRLNGRPFVVAGIAPPGFVGIGGEAQLWVPIDLFDYAHPELAQYGILEGRGTRWHAALGRLRPGVGRQRAEAVLESVASRLRSEHPKSNQSIGVAVVAATDELVGNLRAPLGVLLAGSLFVLLIACANLAHLLLARNAARRHELATRSALGAGRGRLIRQLLTETLLLAGAGAALGLGLAHWAADLLAAAAPSALPPQVDLGLDIRAVGVAALATVGCTLLAGLLPATLGSKASLNPIGTASERGGGRRLRGALGLLVAAETATTALLLVAAGVMLASTWQALRFDPGYATERVLSARFELPADPQRQTELSRRLREEIAALPGIESVARATHVYFAGGYMTRTVTAETASHAGGGDEAMTLWVDPGFFSTLDLPLLAGRDFTAADREGAPAVAVINESFAQRRWPAGEAVGRRVRLGGPDEPDAKAVEIVGVVPDVQPRLRARADGPRVQLYRPVAQDGAWARRLLVRTKGDPVAQIDQLRSAAAAVDPDLPVWAVTPMAELVRESSADTRLLSWILTAFAALAAVLAATGVYGILAFSAQRQRREIGVRLALGAQRSEAGRRILATGAVATAVGLAVGLSASWVAARWLSAVVYQVDPRHPAVFAAAAALVAATAAAGAWLPARRASRLDPGTILREG